MGTIYTLRCRRCGHEFQRRYGVGYNGQGTLYCDRCGKAQAVDFGGGWELPPACECGGTFDADALGRCPQCGTMLSKEDIDYNQEFRCWE